MEAVEGLDTPALLMLPTGALLHAPTPDQPLTADAEAPRCGDAHLRKRRRGGQSFVLVPRILDLPALQVEPAELAPTLRVVAAHGRTAPQILVATVLGLARDAGDVLLATNIITGELDIPHANPMVVSGARCCGPAQLHQPRGRVERGARRI